MKNKNMKKSLVLGALLISSLTFGQKKNVTSAAVEIQNKYKPALSGGDFVQAKKSLLSAKEFIDLAVENPETKADQKAHWYKGLIYFSGVFVSYSSKDAEFIKSFGSQEDALTQSVQSLKYGYSLGNKHKSDIEETAEIARVEIDKLANKAYTDEDFKSAAMYYDWRAKFASAVNQMDTNALFNSALCASKSGNHELAAANYLACANAGYRGAVTYSLASGEYRKLKNIEKAKEVVNLGRTKYANDKDLLLELVNINLDANDPVGAESALTSAISADPKNKNLHYTIGTIYIDLKENEKAEASLLKALEIDPDYEDAQYQLGAHLVSWAVDLKTQASNLKLGDAQYDVLLAKSDEVYKRALNPLEKYITKNPNDGPVLKILSQLHRAIGNADKASEYKKRADAAK